MYKVNESFYGVSDTEMFELAKRVNKKRSFLFVSKVLGKHLPAKSSDVLYYSMLLSKRLNEVFVGSVDGFDWSLSKKKFVDSYLDSYYHTEKEMIFVGFAETATGLGQCVFDRFDNSVYFQTTREVIDGIESVLTFEEEHSHATSHYCYVDSSVLNNRNPIVLVDDEVTTGNTSLNIIKDIQVKFPRDEYVVVSYLNWMSDDEKKMYREYEESAGVKIHFVYLMSGEIDRTYMETLDESGIEDVCAGYGSPHVDVMCDMFKSSGGYIRETGRFGITHEDQQRLKRKLFESTFKRGGDLVIIGDGELMYLPIMISYYLGDHFVKTTTRSPIHVLDDSGYLIRDGFRFRSLDGKDVMMHLYNNKESFSDAIIVLENTYDRDNLNEFVNHLIGECSFNNVSILKLAWGI